MVGMSYKFINLSSDFQRQYQFIFILQYSLQMFLFKRIHQLFISKQKQILRQLRNIDYEAKRKQAIHEYNQKITQEKNKYNLQYQKYLRFQKQNANTDKITQIYKEKSLFLQKYTKTLSNLSTQLSLKLNEVNQQEKTNTVKLYLIKNLKEEQKISIQKQINQDESGEKDASKKMYIPNGMIVKKIYHTKKNQAHKSNINKQILLLGVQKQDEHCFYISKMIDQFKIENVITMIPPNLPFFIKTENSYLDEWQKFITNADYAKKSKFYLNPLPKTLSDICLQKHQIPLIKQGLSKSKSFLQNYNMLLQQNEITKKFEPAPLFTCLFPQGVERIYFADYPAYEQRRMIADSISLTKLRQLFQQHLYHIKHEKYNFSAQWLFPKQVLSKKLNHINGIVRAVSQISEGRSLVLCPAEIAQLLCIEWQLSKEGQLAYNYYDNNYYFNLAHKKETEIEQTFVEFVEKLVILDIIIEPILTNYFIKYKSFPFMCQHTIGGKQNLGKIFVVWMHYYKLYYDSLTQKRLQSNLQREKRRQYQSKFQNPKNLY